MPSRTSKQSAPLRDVCVFLSRIPAISYLNRRRSLSILGGELLLRRGQVAVRGGGREFSDSKTNPLTCEIPYPIRGHSERSVEHLCSQPEHISTNRPGINIRSSKLRSM